MLQGRKKGFVQVFVKGPSPIQGNQFYTAECSGAPEIPYMAAEFLRCMHHHIGYLRRDGAKKLILCDAIEVLINLETHNLGIRG
jgi:hypothetical protein